MLRSHRPRSPRPTPTLATSPATCAPSPFSSTARHSCRGLRRMACARCDFYDPKASTKGQLVEARGNLQRMLVEIPLTEVERAAVEDGGDAITQLLDRLADVPTPTGATPRALGTRAQAVEGAA